MFKNGLKMVQQIKELKGLNKILPERRRIKKVRDPLENQDAVTKAFADATYIAI